MDGWICLHRKFTEWEWYTDENTMRVFLHLLLKANYYDNRWQGHEIKRGQLITSYSHLAEELKLSVHQVRTALNKLKMTNEITIKTSNKFTLITIEKYSVYQDEENKSGTQSGTQNGNQVAIKRQTSGNK